jgi:hypothetical protein
MQSFEEVFLTVEFAVSVVMGIFGAVVHTCKTAVHAIHVKKKMSALELFTALISAMLSAAMFGFGALVLHPGETVYLYIATATGGILGLKGLSITATLVLEQASSFLDRLKKK